MQMSAIHRPQNFLVSTCSLCLSFLLLVLFTFSVSHCVLRSSPISQTEQENLRRKPKRKKKTELEKKKGPNTCNK